MYISFNLWPSYGLTYRLKVSHLILLPCLGLFSIVLLPSPAKALQFTEIAYDIAGSDAAREWIELYNETATLVDLSESRLQVTHTSADGSVTQASHRLSLTVSGGADQSQILLGGGEYLILSQNPEAFILDYPGFISKYAKAAFSALPNYQNETTKTTTLKVIDSLDQVKAEVTYAPEDKTANPEGFTRENKGDHGWQRSAVQGGSPGQANSPWIEASEAKPLTYPSGIRISEIYPNPAGGDAGHEWVEVENIAAQGVDLTGWYITDASGSKQQFSDGATINPAERLALIVTQLSINNSSTKQNERIALYWPNGEMLEEVVIAGDAKEGWSYVRFGDEWQWTDLPTSGTENRKRENPVSTGVSITTSMPPTTIKADAKPARLSSPSTAVTSTSSVLPKSSSSTKIAKPVRRSPAAQKRFQSSPNSAESYENGYVAGVNTDKSSAMHRGWLWGSILFLSAVTAAVGLLIYRYKLFLLIPKIRELWPPTLLK